MSSEMSTLAQRAVNSNTKRSIWDQIKDWSVEADFVEVGFMIIGVAVLLGITLYEAFNAGSGFGMFASGLVPAPIAWIAGVAVTLGYIRFHRQASEKYRAKMHNSGHKHLVVAMIFAFITLFGVFSNAASKTALSANTAKESNTSRTLLLAEQRQLRAEVQPDQLLGYKALVDVTERTILSKEGEAKAWEMPDGASSEECAQDLRPRQRQLCNSLNGSDDQMGLRNELVMNRAAIETFNVKQKRLGEVDAALADLKFDEKNAHWSSMSKMAGTSADDEFFRIWGTFIVSLCLLIGAGFGWDAVFERLEEDEVDEGYQPSGGV